MQFSAVRTATILIATLLGILFMVPNFLPKEVLAVWPDFLPKQTMTLGLDLQGGSHLLLQVNRESIVTERVKELRRDARSKLANEHGITVDEAFEHLRKHARAHGATVQAVAGAVVNVGLRPA